MKARIAELFANLTYEMVFKWITILCALGFILFYAIAAIHGFNPDNPLTSIPALMRVSACIGITLLMGGTPALSLMRVVQLLTMLLIANLG
ncbi:MAG: hypothetical protein PHE17_09035 [Thiothrix sp.]|uniref:hypothetical protein n=1 Tax=Thiothrix sp. TaxID=1032 RepID=UPI0026190341|nr:hypothetical protein [Thiothrix sp.]MDD5393148.1 hypothetical protein [Thiothrix sp.]